MTVKCFNCQNVCEVKTSSGHSKPENKGRQYINCINCNRFSWVENGESQSPSGLKVDYSKIPDRKAPEIQVRPQTIIDEDEMPSDMFKSTSSDEKPDWDAIRRQEYRFRASMEFVKGHGMVELTDGQKAYIKELVDFAMTGK